MWGWGWGGGSVCMCVWVYVCMEDIINMCRFVCARADVWVCVMSSQ